MTKTRKQDKIKIYKIGKEYYMAIQVKSPIKAMIAASSLENATEKIDFYTEGLMESCTQIKTAWQSETVDKETYVKDLEDSISNLNTLIAALKKLNSETSNYAQQLAKTSQRV